MRTGHLGKIKTSTGRVATKSMLPFYILAYSVVLLKEDDSSEPHCAPGNPSTAMFITLLSSFKINPHNTPTVNKGSLHISWCGYHLCSQNGAAQHQC